MNPQRASLTVLVVLLGGVAGCGTESGTVEPAPDSGAMAPADAGAEPALMPVLEVGTGDDVFVPVADGDVVPMIHGYQGLQHVWVSVRARDFDPDRAIIELTLDRERDGTALADRFRARLPFDVAPGGDWVERTGMRLVIPRPSSVLGQALVLSATVENRAGVTVTARRSVTVVWEEDIGGTTR